MALTGVITPQTFGFRIFGYYKGGGWTPGAEERELVFPGLPHLRVTMCLPKDRHAGNRVIVLLGGGFATNEEARAIGARVKKAAILAAVADGFGLDLGRDEVLSAAPTVDGRPHDMRQPQVHGLHVFPECERTRFGFLYAGEPEPRDAAVWRDEFETILQKAYALQNPLTTEQILASQLYADSHFQPLGAARLLLLVSAIEALTEDSARSDAAVRLVMQMLDLVTSDEGLDPSEKSSLGSQLSWLKQHSIRSKCKKLVRAHCDEEAADRFLEAYDVRSSLLHAGRTPPLAEINPLVSALGAIVRRTLVGEINQRERSVR